MWQLLWDFPNEELPATIKQTLKKLKEHSSPELYPNITTIVNVTLVIPATSTSVERSNSSLKLIKKNKKLRSTMTEVRLNALLLLFVHRDIELNIDYHRLLTYLQISIYAVCYLSTQWVTSDFSYTWNFRDIV